MPYIGYAFIIAICVVVGLVAFGKIKPKAYPYILYGIAASMVLMTSLAGRYLVGSDIHLEYYYALLRAGKDVVAPIVGIPQGTSIITYLTDNIWVWKVVYPLIFAFVPVLLYFIFRKYLTPNRAFLASFLFIAFPAFSMELPGIVRQMIAEVLLVGVIYTVYVSNLRARLKIPILIVCSALMPLIHYAIGIIALILLGLGLFVGQNRKLVGVMCVAVIITGAIYFPVAEDGAVAIKLAHIWNSWVPARLEIDAPPIEQPMFVNPEWAEHPPEVTPPDSLPFLKRYEALILSGLGFDFMETTTLGRIFRALQWVILGIMAYGVWVARKYKKYWIFAGGGMVLILFLLIPGFSNLLNVTRFIHIALLALAPLFVMAIKPKVVLSVLLIYFLFTSGFVFEITKQDNIEQLTIPYNVGLSSHRLDLGASVTEDDWEVRRFINENELYPVASDIVGADFVGEVVGWRDDLHVALRREPVEVYGVYVFVRSRNIQDGTFTAWNGVGCRKYVDPMEYYGFDWDDNIVYQKGGSRVIWLPEVQS